MEYILIGLGAYLFGSINFSIILARVLQKIDIRDVNSHNPGASNVTLTLGLKWGVVIFILDVLKGFIPVFFTKLVFPDLDILWVVAGIGALLGHVFPLYFRFRGGKGTSTYMGVIFGLFPVVAGILLAVLIITTLISDYIAIGTLFLLLPPPIYMVVTKDYHWIGITLLSLFIVINLYKHRNNFVAIYKGEEKGVLEAIKK